MNKNFIFIGVVAVVISVIAITSKDNVEPTTEQIPTDTKNDVSSEEERGELEHTDHHLHEVDVVVSDDGFKADMNAIGLIPQANESGAVGYGVITTEGTDAVVVSTTHAGVLDSEVQKDASDPVWHNHVVKLGEVVLCGEDPGVIDITFESPGTVEVKDSQLVMIDVPSSFEGSHSLNGSNLVFKPGTDIQKVVEFTLNPKFNEDEELQAVCVSDIKEIPFNLI